MKNIFTRKGVGIIGGLVLTNENKGRIAYKNSLMVRLFASGQPEAARKLQTIMLDENSSSPFGDRNQISFDANLDPNCTEFETGVGRVALGNAFYWTGTKDGHDYWQEVDDTLRLYETIMEVESPLISEVFEKAYGYSQELEHLQKVAKES